MNVAIITDIKCRNQVSDQELGAKCHQACDWSVLWVYRGYKYFYLSPLKITGWVCVCRTDRFGVEQKREPRYHIATTYKA